MTGGGGFIGRFVLNSLVRNGASVRALMGAPGQRIQSAPTEVLTAIADITDAAVVSKLLAGCDVVVHLAGPPSVSASFTQSAEYFRIHVCGTDLILRACHAAGVKRFVYMSSAEVYGPAEMPSITEDHPTNPVSPYGKVKSLAEKLIQTYAGKSEMQTMILRAFSIYGPGMSQESVLGTILRQAESNDCIELQDLRPIRDYCYVGDLADAVVLSCAARLNGSYILNIGTGVGTSVSELAKLVLQICRRNLPIRETTVKERPVACEIYRLIANNSLAKRVLDWTPAAPLRLGIEQTLLHWAMP